MTKLRTKLWYRISPALPMIVALTLFVWSWSMALGAILIPRLEHALQPQTHQLWMIRSHIDDRLRLDERAIDICKAHFDGMNEGLMLGSATLPHTAWGWLQEHPDAQKEWRQLYDKRLEQVRAAGEMCPERVREAGGKP